MLSGGTDDDRFVSHRVNLRGFLCKDVVSFPGFPHGNIYHVQRSHWEKRLPFRLDNHEHDAK